MTARDLTTLVHLLGFMTGIVLYAMLGVMTRRRLANVVATGDSDRDDRVSLSAAVLGVVWNVGAMVVFAARDFGLAAPLTWVAAIAYSALGFLPAVVVHSTLHRSKRSDSRWFLIAAYGASGVAALMHGIDGVRGETPSPSGLLLLTVTYAALLGLLAITERRRPGFQRTIVAVALAAFAVSALHLSRQVGQADQGPWWVELLGHHASLPLALAILYQDYRFAFADVFLKRALALVVLVIGVSLLYAELVAPLVDPHAIAARHALEGGSHLVTTGVLLSLWIATALAFPMIQRRIYRFVDRVVLRRADYRDLRARLSQRLTDARDVESTLDATCEMLAAAVGAHRATWLTAAARSGTPHPTITLDSPRTEASIVIPTALAPAFEIRLAELGGGRSMLSDDLLLIDGVAALVGRRIDGIRVESDRRAREAREQEMGRLAAEAELRALRAQLNPHFLFNALTTLGHLMQATPDRALATLYQLTGLLRAVLRRTTGQFVALREELEIVESYLAIERERFQERLDVSIEIPAELRQGRVPPLLLQPLVENAVKHGIAPVRAGGHLTIRATRDVTPDDTVGFLRVSVIDTGRGFDAASVGVDSGVGLSNLRGRLRHYFGPGAALNVGPTPGGGTTVEVCIPWIADGTTRPLAGASGD